MQNEDPVGEIDFESLFSLQGLRNTWRTLRKESRRLEIRDVLDWADWSVTLDASLDQLRTEILSGSYVPSPATRYEVGKSKGSFRLITALNIRDALVYRHLCDHAYEKALPLKIPGAFFSRRHTSAPVGSTFSLRDDAYYRSFEVWLRYNEYRSRTMLSGIYDVLVVTDITNYFDSISHNILLEYLAPLGLPRKAIGLLGKLLESYKPPTGHSPNPRIGLPQDELDCSRELAHIFLFEHDHRMADEAGIENYVRWMDDQNIGARDLAHAKRVVNSLTRSLSTQRLTLNDGKTRFLSPEGVAAHFQLEANSQLTDLGQRHNNFTRFSPPKAKQDFEETWAVLDTRDHARMGNWNKVLKRAYGLAIRVNSSALEERALDDLVDHPFLAPRIFQYFAKRNRAQSLLSLFQDYCDSNANLFEATEASFLESALLLDLTPGMSRNYLKLARELADGSFSGQTGKPLGRSSAILLLYWLGETAVALSSLYSSPEAVKLPKEVARAWLACSTARRLMSLDDVRAELFGHASDDVSRLARFLRELINGNIEDMGNYKSLKSRWPIAGKFYDTRAWLMFDLASRSPSIKLRQKLKTDLGLFSKYARTRQEHRVLSRISPRLT